MDPHAQARANYNTAKNALITAVTGWPREDDFDYDTWKPKV